jgi:hypothetical protein
LLVVMDRNEVVRAKGALPVQWSYAASQGALESKQRRPSGPPRFKHFEDSDERPPMVFPPNETEKDTARKRKPSQTV